MGRCKGVRLYRLESMTNSFLTDSQRRALAEGAERLEIRLADDQLDQFDRFAGLLYDWNARLNLTRVPVNEVVPLHFLDSLAVQRAVDFSGGKLIDVGTGAGFPGIPLKIAFPRLAVTLLDSTRKRLTFLEHVIADLGIENIHTV